MKKLTAILPARLFDSKIENKNLLPFLDSNLLEHKINQLKKVRRIKNIVVCSDSKKIEEIALKNKVDFLKRETVKNEEDSFSNLINLIVKNYDGDILIANCCTPFIEEDKYTNAIETYFEKINEGYDSLISVLPFKRFVIDDNGALNFKKGTSHKESASLNQLYFWIAGITIANAENMEKWHYSWGKIPYKFILSKKEALEIKDLEDLKIARSLEKHYE